MKHLYTRIAVLGWAALWFVVIAPAHQRGLIRVPGTVCVDGSCQTPACEIQQGRQALAVSSCCPAPSSSDNRESPGKPGDPVKSCAVCHLLAKLEMPAEVLLTADRCDTVIDRLISAPAKVWVAPSTITDGDRGPPTA